MLQLYNVWKMHTSPVSNKEKPNALHWLLTTSYYSILYDCLRYFPQKYTSDALNLFNCWSLLYTTTILSTFWSDLSDCPMGGSGWTDPFSITFPTDELFACNIWRDVCYTIRLVCWFSGDIIRFSSKCNDENNTCVLSIRVSYCQRDNCLWVCLEKAHFCSPNRISAAKGLDLFALGNYFKKDSGHEKCYVLFKILFI